MRASSAKCVRFGRARCRSGTPCSLSMRFNTGSRCARTRAAAWTFSGTLATLDSLPALRPGRASVRRVHEDAVRSHCEVHDVADGRRVAVRRAEPEGRTTDVDGEV